MKHININIFSVLLFALFCLLANNLQAQEDLQLSKKTLRQIKKQRARLKMAQWALKGEKKLNEKDGLANKADSLLAIREDNITTDTMWVEKDKSTLILKTYATVYSDIMHIRSVNAEGSKSDLFVKSDLKTTLGFSANYRGISASFAINPSKFLKKNSDVRYELNYYNNKYGIDAGYQDVHNLSVTDHFLKRIGNDKIANSSLKSLSVNGYYVFNGKRFSYPAVFNNTWTQKRSAGSFLASASFYYGRAKSDDDAKGIQSGDNMVHGLKMRHISVGAGYAYNWVVNPRLVLHISAQPSIMMWKDYKINERYRFGIDESEKTPDGAVLKDGYATYDYWRKMPSNKFNFYIVGRAGGTYNINNSQFIAATAVVQSFKTGRDSEFSLVNTNWKVRASYGWRF